MKKLKVVTVVGTRPEIIRLACVMQKLDEHCEHILVHTGQNYDYELNEIFFNDLGIRKPDYFLGAAGKSGAETIGNVIIAVDKVLAEVEPEAVLVLGDTNSCMSVLPAKRRKIPVFHMEAGNRCFDQRVPEEINRRLVDHMADMNLTYSSIARDYLLAEGLPADRVIKTGSPMFEVLNTYRDGIEASDVLERLELNKHQFFVVSAHREENIDSDKNFVNLMESLNAIAENYQMPVIVSTHPRTQKRIDQLAAEFNSQRVDQTGIEIHPLIQFLKPLGFKDYNKLQLCAKAVLSDSGTINEESSIMNFPALNLREAHERPEGMEEAAVIMTGLQKERILQSLAIIDTQLRDNERLIRQVYDYSMPNVSDKIVRIIHSYTDYVNRVVWKKY
ncbi:UDP-N-acetylglucosamine 2-epimerase (non-hydrolyzing) [Thiomicrorhabdus sp. 6S2-11]|uniref:UDP-N-acetylglucosamine 2-epimerase (Non-hydrolyzing) n=1 Tax=Thiomicrorhabdus marina TaxID=2818442 RepID=A0ABS3Q1V7_9GAMM|nr:UDP-N-acetylglucosamine 2-epimerase (non-hydrolyzing) [Thiomicrorhabdus marina]MBO1926322.1 UDP-N-acetylglucosamine 2-epimerase (non-hydrolyzing) [Thiomicrorhabdus marina]